MTNEEYATLERCAADAARKLMARGYPKEQAIKIATEMAMEAVRRKYPHGMGTLPPTVPGTQDPLDEIAAKSQAAADIGIVKSLRETISPWLWVTSLIGFGMGLLNSRRIAKMYGDWRRKKGGKK